MPRRNRVQDEIESDQETAALTRNDSITGYNEDHENDGNILTGTTKTDVSEKKKTKVKHEKRATKQKHLESAVKNSGAQNDAVIPFDKDEFLATTRPIPKRYAETINGVMRDLQHLASQVEHVGFELVTETAMAIEEVAGDTKDGEEELDLLMRNLIDAQEEIKAHERSLDDLKQQILREEPIADLENTYTTKAAELKQDYAKKTARQKYARHDKYFNFKEQVWEVNHEDAMPPLKDLLPREENDSENDSDIEVGGKTRDYKCPLTLRIMQNPVTSPCGHSFSMEGIREFLQNGRRRTVCPATSCQQVVALSDFKPNEQLARRIADHVRRARRKEDESDEENTQVVD